MLCLQKDHIFNKIAEIQLKISFKPDEGKNLQNIQTAQILKEMWAKHLTQLAIRVPSDTKTSRRACQ